MSTLILQIQIKQWDKSQRSAADVAARAAIADRSPITAKPEFFILNRECLIDVKGGDFNKSQRPLKKSLLADGSVKLERFILSIDKTEKDEKLRLAYQDDKKDKVVIGNLNDGWIQARYTWRYSVEKNEQIFWQYEEIILNVANLKTSAESLDADHFITTPAHLTFEATN